MDNVASLIPACLARVSRVSGSTLDAHSSSVPELPPRCQGMNYSKRKRDGLWTPCTNVAFVMCALRGWLPGQGGVPLVHLATPGRSLMRRCRPCAECKPTLFWDECYIVRSGTSSLTQTTYPCPQHAVRRRARPRPCADVPACDHSASTEYCMVERYCANGFEIWNRTGNWTCVPRQRLASSVRPAFRTSAIRDIRDK